MGRASASCGFCVGSLSMNPLKSVPCGLCDPAAHCPAPQWSWKQEGFAVIVIIIDIPNTAKLTMDLTVSMQT